MSFTRHTPSNGRSSDQTPEHGRRSPLIRVDSLLEAHSHLAAFPSAVGQWRIVSESRSTSDNGATLTMEVVDPAGETTERRFDTRGFAGTAGVQRLDADPTEYLDRLLQRALEFAADNPPHHPGSLPRFPIPSSRYKGRLEVPMAVMAADSTGRAALYAPPRAVVIGAENGEPIGVGEYPGFDPEVWPPPRLGSWPPPNLAQRERHQIHGAVGRLSGLWYRLIAAWWDERHDYPQRSSEALEAREIIGLLDLPEMLPFYERLNPPFWRWIGAQY